MFSSTLKIFLLILTIHSTTTIAQEQRLGNLLENLNQNKAVSKTLTEAFKQLKTDAELALELDSFSVVFNSPIPPSGNKKDYYSWPPYLWPNPDTPDGLPYVHKDGRTNPETEIKSDKLILRQMATSIYHLSLAYYYLNDEKYAQKAIALLNTWFIDPITSMNPNLNFGQCVPGKKIGEPYGIIDTRWFVLVVDALQILRATGRLDTSTDEAMQQWFSNYTDWLLDSRLGKEEARVHNNHGSWYYAQVATFAAYTGDHKLLKFVLNDSKQFFDLQIDSVGRQVLELHRTKSYDYSLYNVHALITLAKIAEQHKIDIWYFKGNKGQSLQQSIKHLAQFYLEDDEWPYEQITEKAIQLSYKDGKAFSVYYPYDLYHALLVGYKVYKDPYFLKCLKKIQEKDGMKHFTNLLVHFPKG